jgi:hypothetical protein
VTTFARWIFAAWLLAVLAPPAAAQDCRAPDPVCAARDAVFAVAAADPLASAVRIDGEHLVTNRHVVADQNVAEVILADGTRLTAEVVPTAYPGDLVLLRLAGLPHGPVAQPLAPDTLAPDTSLYTVGADIDLDRIEVYPPGAVLRLPAAGKPSARLHHSAFSRPGNSGGALLDGAGRLVAIVASGGDRYFEAIPAAEIARLKAMSGPEHQAAGRRLGRAYWDCQVALDHVRVQGTPVTDEVARHLGEACLATGNRQLFDDAGRALGRVRRIEESIPLFEASLAQDPNAILARQSLVVSLHIARRYEDELPHLKWLLEVTPADPQVLRFAVQAGKWAGDEALAARALALTETHHPQAAAAARRFLESGPPAPQ